MVLSKEFIESTQEMIDGFIEDIRRNSYQLITQDIGLLSDHPQDFNFGHGLGFLTGSISMNFTFTFDRQMNLEEHLEIQTLIAKIAPEYKKLIFKGGN